MLVRRRADGPQTLLSGIWTMLSPPSSQPQLVLLDHGLYAQLEDSFRRAYCRMWAAILDGDVGGIKHWGSNLGAGEDGSYLLSAALVMRPWNDIVDREIVR